MNGSMKEEWLWFGGGLIAVSVAIWLALKWLDMHGM